jgi:type II secretory pathway pseudopilin PulG
MARRPAPGFTYLGMLILLAVLGLVGAAGLKMGTLLQRAAAEEELLEIGAQFSEALRSYAAATPQGQPQQPPSLQDLLKDPRFPNPRRHLRKIFVDPVTGKAEWGILYIGDKVGVLGVYSLSNARPLKVANFDIRFLGMENREHISDWKFLMAGGDGGAPSQLTPPNSMTAAPSLFGPGTSLSVSGDSKGGGAAAPDEPKVGSGPVPPELRQPMEPAADGAVPEGPADEPKPEENQPTPPPPEEEKEAEPVQEAEPAERAKPAEPSTLAPLPPPVSHRKGG